MIAKVTQEFRSYSSGNGENRGDLFKIIPSLHSFFALRVDPHDIDDMMQDVALRLHLCRNRDSIGSGRAYLYRIARSVVVDRYRRDAVRHRAQHEAMEAEDQLVEERCPGRVVEGRQQLELALKLLHELPERTWTAFQMHRFEQMTVPEIARYMSISVSAVEKHIMRASRYLAAGLNA